MFLEISMQIYSVVFASSRQINKQKYAKTINFLCAVNKVFVKYQAQWGVNPKPPLAYALGYLYVNLSKHILDYRKKQTGTLLISENIPFTNDNVMNYVIGPSSKNCPGPPYPLIRL